MSTVKKNREREIWESPPSLNTWWVEVSNLGRVRTLTHTETFIRLGKIQTRQSLGRIRTLAKDTRGRYQCFLTPPNNSRPKGYLVHRLVAECFVDNPNPKRYNFVLFKNNNIADCRAINLQWGDSKDRSYNAGWSNASFLIEVFDGDVKCGEFIGTGGAARELGVTKQAIWDAMKKGKLCKGFVIKGRPIGKHRKPRSIEEGRRAIWGNFSFIDIPERIYSEREIDITPKAVF